MSLLDRRVRGFRLVDLVALGLLTMLILGVYLAKAIAGRERAEIATVERQIEGEKSRIRLLQAEVSHLEQPARIERLSQTYLGLQPLPIKHEATAEELVEALRKPSAPATPGGQPAATAISNPIAAPVAAQMVSSPPAGAPQ
jgi:cell division protein FtsL